jgi:hypothetical protein
MIKSGHNKVVNEKTTPRSVGGAPFRMWFMGWGAARRNIQSWKLWRHHRVARARRLPGATLLCCLGFVVTNVGAFQDCLEKKEAYQVLVDFGGFESPAAETKP